MTTSSEPPSRAFPRATKPYCDIPSLTDPADRSAQPLMACLPSMAARLQPSERIHLSDTRDVMRHAVMHMRQPDCLVFRSPDDTQPLGYVPRQRLAVEQLSGNRRDVRRLVGPAPCRPVSLSVGEALHQLHSQQAELGLLGTLDGDAMAPCTRQNLLCLAEDRL